MKKILSHPLAVVALMILFVTALSMTLTNAVIMPAQEQHREEFIFQCEHQGGDYIELRHSQYCIIDGVKISR